MDDDSINIDKSGKLSKRFLFTSRTFNSKLFLKLTASIVEPSIICIQTLRYEPENRKLFEIELAIPWLQTFPELMKYINLEETPKSSRKFLIELAWFLFYKYYKKNKVLKKAGEKQEFFYISLGGKILKLNIVYERKSLTFEEYLIYLFKMKLTHEKEILKKCRSLNSFIADIDGENLHKFCKDNPQYNYEKIKEKAKNEIINLGFKLEDFQDEISTLINSIENYLKIALIKKNVKSLSNGINATPKFYIGRYEKAGYINKGQSIGNLTPEICSDNSTYICMDNCDIVYLNKNNSKLEDLFNLVIRKNMRALSHFKDHFLIFNQIDEHIFHKVIIPHFEYKQYNKGEKIFIQGSMNEGLYLIKEGKVNLYLNSSRNEMGNYIMNIKNTLSGFKEYISNINNNNSILKEDTIKPKIINDKNNLDKEKSDNLNIIKKFDIMTVSEKSIFGTNELYDYKTGIYFFSAECISKEAIIYFLPKKYLYPLLIQERPLYISFAKMIEFRIRDIIGKLKYQIKCFDTIMNKKNKTNNENNLNTLNTLNSINTISTINSLKIINTKNQNDSFFNNFLLSMKNTKRNKFHRTLILNKKIEKLNDFPLLIKEKKNNNNNNTLKEYKIRNKSNYILTDTINSCNFKNNFHKSLRDKLLYNKNKKFKITLTPSNKRITNLSNQIDKNYIGKLFLSEEKKKKIRNHKINLPFNFPFNVQNSFYQNSTFLSKKEYNYSPIMIK